MAGILSNLIAQLTGFGLGETQDWLQRRREEEDLRKGYAALGPYLQTTEQQANTLSGLISGGIAPDEQKQIQGTVTPVMPYDVYRVPGLFEQAMKAYGRASMGETFRGLEEQREKQRQQLIKGVLTGSVGKVAPKEAIGMFEGTTPVWGEEDYLRAQARQVGTKEVATQEAKLPYKKAEEERGQVNRLEAIGYSGAIQAGLINQRTLNEKELALWKKEHGLGGGGGGEGDKGLTPSVMRGIFTDATGVATKEILNDPGVKNKGLQWIVKKKGIAPEFRAGYDWETLSEGDKAMALQAIGVDKLIQKRRNEIANEMVEIIKTKEFPTGEPATTETPTAPVAETQTQEQDPYVTALQQRIDEFKKKGETKGQIMARLKAAETNAAKPIPWDKLKF